MVSLVVVAVVTADWVVDWAVDWAEGVVDAFVAVWVRAPLAFPSSPSRVVGVPLIWASIANTMPKLRRLSLPL